MGLSDHTKEEELFVIMLYMLANHSNRFAVMFARSTLWPSDCVLHVEIKYVYKN